MKKINFARIPAVLDLPNLIEVQRNSFAEFLQMETVPEKRKSIGLQAAFTDVFPISSTNGEYSLEFVSYQFDSPKFTEEESLSTDSSYTAPLKATFRLFKKQEKGNPKEISQQDVYICDLPLMTQNATFIINGVERVIVTQMHRSPGVIFEEDEENKISSYGKRLYFARIIPYRGAWVEFEFDIHNVLWVRIDKKRKFLATTLLRATGLDTDADILKAFYKTEKLPVGDSLSGRITASDIIDTSTGEVILESNKTIGPDEIKIISASQKIKTVEVIVNNLTVEDTIVPDNTIHETLALDKNRTKQDAIMDIYKKIRAMEYISPEHAETFLDNLILKNPKKYDLSKVGRYKINDKLKPVFEELGLKTPKDTKKTLTLEDLISVIKYVLDLNNGVPGREIDDIDHLGNRRIRAVGELLENQIRIGLAHMVRITREKMNMQDHKLLTPRTILNTQPVIGIVRKFFGTHQLSQFMDQINPLAELTHKRRLSALGPGGLHRKRAGFEVRDVHHTHYGRVCPIETPEGPNVGLITSLSCYAKVNEYGLIETPYRLVQNGKITDKIEYLTADREEKLIIAQANSHVDKSGKLVGPAVASRKGGEILSVPPSQVNYMDISPLQMVSVSAGLIPFLAHDDANRALMGSNMMRQAVPLLLTESPIVGTGIEDVVARDSHSVIVSKSNGQVLSVDARQIAVKDLDKNDITVYKLRKFQRSNQDTCIDQVPIVKKGDIVKKGQIIADGPATKNGDLALGKNLIVAFMPWEGYNYEDAVLVSERLIKEDTFTSIHIQEFIVEARDTKLGPEEISKDIPNVSKDALLNLDENGIITIGSIVAPGDILVGKVTPRGDQQTTPEERLLRVIFGKKAEDVVDASMRVPPGVTGKISDVKVFTRKEKLSKAEEKKRRESIGKKYEQELILAKNALDEKLKSIRSSKLKKSEKNAEIIKAKELFKKRQSEIKASEKLEKESLKTGNELPIGVNKVVKVYIASMRKLQVGDKVSGRHGNKGVVAKILPVEDMPYLPDGSPVDVVVSPLSVPSRMNIGQMLEIMLGWAGITTSTQMICPVFDSAKEEDIREQIAAAKRYAVSKGANEKFLPDNNCKITLYDGRTGVPFAEKITIGCMYMMKLGHLVEDKMHARSTGPYSLITRQPLGGKAQFGGQRFGEMEVWAIEGYGAAHTLQEFLTIKSDDVVGRTKTYESIINDKPITYMGIPESFKVLVKELQSLGLSMELLK
ncbi:MAG: DNA-directed RNA polymerase subunit beta [Elusimicrobia bacterium ADurb.Bin231]|nr:MAG: DNA-directed RNA polymerase subunit beta [Elusimicrobia bacterium ADurb.Bin231]